MMKKLLALLSGLLILTGCWKEVEVGTKKRPFRMYFVPSVDTETIASGTDVLVRYIEKEISQELYGKDEGFYVEAAIPTSFIAVVEAIGSQKADFAAFNTFSYILAKDVKKYPLRAMFSILRGKNKEKYYKAQIITHVDSGINSLQDLNGKRFAFADPASTSGHILPRVLFKDNNIHLAESVYARRHDSVVMMVYQKQVDAGATYFSPPVDGHIRDARERVKTQYPDVEDKVKIIAFSEKIPNEPWVIRTGIYPDNPEKEKKVADAIQTALMKFQSTEEGKKALYALSSSSGLAPADDHLYDRTREIIKGSGLDIEATLKAKAEKKKK